MSNVSNENNKKTIMFNLTKRETHHTTNGYKKLVRKLRTNYQIISNKEEISKEKFQDADVIVFAGSRGLFTKTEFESMKLWLNSGGRIIILSGDGSETSNECNINYFLEEYGISINNDSVLRSVFHKYLHPKEVFIADGVLVPDLARKKANNINSNNKRPVLSKSLDNSKNNVIDKITIVYPYGSTLEVQRPSRPLFSTGIVAYPLNRPIIAAWESDTVQEVGGRRGRLVVIGSVDLFGDDWLDKEENTRVCDILFGWLFNEIDLDLTSDRQDSELVEFTPIPNIEAIGSTIKPCLQGIEEIPKDFTKLFDTTMFKFDVDVIPKVVESYETLGVSHDQLTLIPPQFECPLPKFIPAVFPPSMRDLPPPSLDQFDLDDNFAREDIRLAQLTNKCTLGEEDLEYYIGEAGEILGIMKDLSYGEKGAKNILFHIFKSIVDYKKTEIDNDDVYQVKGYEYQESSEYTIATPAINYNSMVDGPTIEATNLPIHLPKVDYISNKSREDKK
mmetsp:Transcript_9163/g.8186  ORF Transcript_9163/g.8186 Transcript_9163/m.8186 type:complete len:504 (-) Transcript_9163:708-2219(-)